MGTGPVITTLYFLRNLPNKLECLFLADFSSIVKFLWVRRGAYLRLEQLVALPLGTLSQSIFTEGQTILDMYGTLMFSKLNIYCLLSLSLDTPYQNDF
jgi:hypothetical protein